MRTLFVLSLFTHVSEALRAGNTKESQDVTAGPCADGEPRCPEWASFGGCSSRDVFILCQRSCTSCGFTQSALVRPVTHGGANVGAPVPLIATGGTIGTRVSPTVVGQPTAPVGTFILPLVVGGASAGGFVPNTVPIMPQAPRAQAIPSAVTSVLPAIAGRVVVGAPSVQATPSVATYAPPAVAGGFGGGGAQSVVPTVGLNTGGLMPQAFEGGQPIRPYATHPKILLIGDSLTAGWTTGPNGIAFTPYGRTLSERLPDIEVVVNGVSGITARQYVQPPADDRSRAPAGATTGERIELLLEDLSFDGNDVAVILLGTNDLGHGYGGQQIVDDIVKIHRICKEKGMKTIAVGIPPSGSESPRRLKVNDALKRFCQSGECTYFNSEFMREGLDTDRLHYKEDMYGTLGGRLAEVVAATIR